MKAVQSVPCNRPAFCPMLLWVFPRKLVKAISGETKTVKIRPQERLWTFFINRGHAVRKPLQARAAAGAQMQRARDHFADFLHSLAARFFFLGI